MNLNTFFNTLPMWNIEEETGYKPCTTFYQDFSIADRFYLNGEKDGVMDTHRRSWRQVKEMCLGIEGLTEYIMVLNWKIAEHYPKHMELANLYDKLWRECNEWARNNLQGDDLSYYLKTTN